MSCVRVLISVSEPWELGESVRWRLLAGEVLHSADDRALVKLDHTINFGGCSWGYVVVEPRHQGKRIDALQAGEKLICGFTGVSEEQVRKTPSLDTKNWRGGLAFIGDFEPTK